MASSQPFKIALPKAYGGVALFVSLITGGCLVSSDLERVQRSQAFTEEFLDFQFNELHQKEVGDDTASLGMPDDGNGRYMQARPYEDWYFMQIAKRVHRNDIEHLVTFIPASLFNGLILPYPTIGLLATYFLGRQLYSRGYFEKEGALNNYRMAGSALCNLAHMTTLGLTIFLGYRISRGKIRF